MSRYLVLLAALFLLAARPAGAQQLAGAATAGAADQAVRFYGFGGDFFAWDSNSLDPDSYGNQLSLGLSARWSAGRLFFPKSRFGGLTISARALLNRTFAGYDPSQFNADSDKGYCQPGAVQLDSRGNLIGTPGRCTNAFSQSDYRWDFSDMWLTVANPGLVTIPKIKVGISPSVLFIFPTSRQSQFETLRTGMLLNVMANRVFLGGKLVPGYAFGFRKNFHGSTRPQADGFYKGEAHENLLDSRQANAIGQLTDNTFTHAIGGANSGNYSFRHLFSLGGGWKALSYSVMYIISNGFGYEVPIDEKSAPQAVAVGKRDAHTFWATVGYDVTDWLNLNLSYVTSSPFWEYEGHNGNFNDYKIAPEQVATAQDTRHVRQPFYCGPGTSCSYNGFTSISLGFNISIDTIATKLVKVKKN